MRILVFCITIASLLMITMLGASQTSDKTTAIDLMINADIPASATEEEVDVARSNLLNVYEAINGRDLVATIFSTQDLINTKVRLLLTRMGFRSNFELGMSGNHSDEKISTESYAAQSMILDKTKQYVESCNICGQNEITVKGFMPQSFDQNQDTYKALEELGIQYNAGFQAGLLYAPGHENDVWPYLVEGHKFYAVPVSTYTLSGKNVVLQDSYFKDNGLDAAQWYDALVGKFEEVQGKEEPMVISLTTSVSGSGDYLNALNRFMDYAASKKASFVTTAQLVEMAKADVRDVSELPINMTASEGCPTCDQNEGNINATISVIDDTQNDTLETINDSE